MSFRNRLLAGLLLLALPANLYLGYKAVTRLSPDVPNVRDLCVYQDMTAEYRSLNARKAVHGRVVFAGDSLIRRFALEEYFPSTAVLNRGIYLDTVPGLLARWHATVLSAKPRQIVVMIGHNDLSVHEDEVILRGVRRLFSERSGIPFVFMGILPVGENRSELNPRIRDLNRRIKDMAHEFGVRWLSLGPLLSNENGCLAAEYSCDGVHLNGAGYSVWADALRPLLPVPD